MQFSVDDFIALYGFLIWLVKENEEWDSITDRQKPAAQNEIKQIPTTPSLRL